jgi:hypothetical protein
MISLADFRYLEAAQAWLERVDYCNCFEELTRISDRHDVRVQALRWKLYSASGMHAGAADVALDIKRRSSSPFGFAS